MLNILHALQSKIFSLSSPHTQPSVEIHVYLPFLCISGSFLSSSGMWFKESIWSLLPVCLHAFLLVTFFTQLPYPSQKWRVIWCVCSSLMCLLKKCNHMIIQKQISTIIVSVSKIRFESSTNEQEMSFPQRNFKPLTLLFMYMD